jgi:Fe-S-cluster-containing dehydrogenase component
MRIEPEQCHHCDNPPCVRVCPSGASYTDEEGGIVSVNPRKCIGCRYCILACPYGARYFDDEQGVVDKCTFCRHRLGRGQEPACVETCPTKVRTFGDLNDPQSEVSRLLRTRTTGKKKVQAGTGPNLRYIID